MIGFIRYKQLKYCIQVQLVRAMDNGKHFDSQMVRQLNKANFIAYISSIVTAIGLSIPANLRSTEWIMPHTISAAIGCTALYIYPILMVTLKTFGKVQDINSNSF